MFKRKILTLCLGLSILAAGTVFAQIVSRDEQKSDTASSPTGLMKKPEGLKENRERKPKEESLSDDIPDEIVYGQMFLHIKELNKKADEEESKGRNGKQLRNLYKEKAKLNEKQAAALSETAKNVNSRLFEIDTKAKQIIEQVRAKHPDGKLNPGEAPPQPPRELYELSAQRKEVITQAVKDLQKNFNAEEFSKFRDFIDREIKSGITKRQGAKRNSEDEIQ